MKFETYTLIATPDRTISVLLGAGRFVSFLMEDVIREVKGRPVGTWKVAGRTAIPSGTYPFRLEDSPRFGPGTITVADVPGFVGIRMHANAKSDLLSQWSTEGCPLPGLRIVPLKDGADLRISEDEAAVYRIQNMLHALEARGEKSTVTFHRGQ